MAQFGRHTWITLQLFDANAHHLIETIQIFLALVNKIHDKNLMLPLGRNEVNDIRSQYVVMDAIAKIQTLIETTLVLTEGISNGYPSIAKTMTYYDQRLPRQIVEKIPLKNYNFQKILGLQISTVYIYVETKEKC